MIEPVPGLRLVEPLAGRAAGTEGATDVWRGELAGARGGSVAVKRLLVSREERPDLHERFRQEGDLLSALGGRHHLIRCLQVIDAPPMLLLELGEGGSLGTFLARAPLAPRSALVVLRQAADAVDWLHTNDVLHRDLKPSNLVLMGDATWRLVDLGVAARGSPPRGLSSSWVEEEIGTPEWRAPELGRDPLQATRATDTYGLGGLALAMLTGAAPSRWSAVRHELAPGVAAFVGRALAFEQMERYQDVVSFMRDAEVSLRA